MKTKIELTEEDLKRAIALFAQQQGYKPDLNTIQLKHGGGGSDERDQVSWPDRFSATVEVERV
jgi:hypothetical protein